MKWEEFALSILVNATSPCNAGSNQKRVSEERSVTLSRERPSDRETVADMGLQRHRHFQRAAFPAIMLQ